MFLEMQTRPLRLFNMFCLRKYHPVSFLIALKDLFRHSMHNSAHTLMLALRLGQSHIIAF